MTQPKDELFDLGYQRYEGPREGRMRARKALYVHGLRTVLGLGRGARAKVLPVLLFIAIIIPALVFSFIASLADFGDILPSHADYYRIVSVILLLFSAIMAPELLSPDRRDRVIDLYFTRPLTSTDYVAARWLAFFTITLALVYVGQVVLFAGFTLAASSPWDHIRDSWSEIPRFLAAGFAIAVFTTTLPLAVAAFTTRRAIGSAIIIGIYVISLPFAMVLTACEEGPSQNCEPVAGEAGKWFSLVNIGNVPIVVSDLIFDEEFNPNERREHVSARELPVVVPVGWYLVLTGGLALTLVWRYRRLEI